MRSVIKILVHCVHTRVRVHVSTWKRLKKESHTHNTRAVQIAYRNIGEFCEGAYIEFNKDGEFISEVGL
jgi:hypothetical protein